MTERELRERIGAGEGQRLDMKREVGPLDELAADLVCFANAEGGEILIGVDDTGGVVGVADAARVMSQVQEVARNNVESPLRGVDCEAVPTAQGDVVVIRVPRSPDRPHATNRGIAKIRRGNTCQRVTGADLRWMQSSAVASYLDERVVAGTGLADLDLERVEEVLARSPGVRAGNAEGYLRAVRLLLPDGATIAALLCYGREPQRHLPQAVTIAARHRGTRVGRELLDHRELSGRLDQQHDGAAAFVREHLPAPRDLAAPGPEERGLPGEALRQALVNALAHRDYDLPSAIRIHVFDDRVEILSPGALLNSLTIDAMLWGQISLPRNPRTYWELYRMGLATRTGIGVRLMAEAMAERGLPAPEIRVVAAELHVVLRLAAEGVPG